MCLRVSSCGRILDMSFSVVGALVGRLAMITSMPVEKFVCMSIGVV